jgi:hypothetical protein
MGRTVTRKLQNEWAEVRPYYEDYLLCRQTQLMIFRKPTKRAGEEKIVTVVWPTGFGTLPDEGGWYQQDYLTTRLFAAALRGEQRGVARNMKTA